MRQMGAELGADLEIVVERRGCEHLAVHRVDARRPRPGSQLLHELVDLVRSADRHDFDASIRKIARVPAQTELSRPLQYEPPEPDALHDAANLGAHRT
jgi:hypothetical protein